MGALRSILDRQAVLRKARIREGIAKCAERVTHLEKVVLIVERNRRVRNRRSNAVRVVDGLAVPVCRDIEGVERPRTSFAFYDSGPRPRGRSGDDPRRTAPIERWTKRRSI